MKLLVADDSEVILSLVGLVAQHRELDFIPARDGAEALERFKEVGPDLVLTDFEMPGLNGLELCREIKKVIGQRFVPIVMMTASSERAVRDQALELGVIEFLEKPLVPNELSCRLNTLSELARLHYGLERYKEEAEQEMSLAKHILERVVQRERESLPAYLRMETVSTRRANGDLCIHRRTLTGCDRGIICDATGHGLSSGICTLPLAETFLSMAPQAFRLEAIFHEANAKLLARLPVDRFVCTLLFELDPVERRLSILNAGLPDAYLIRRDGSVRAFPSVLPPAGILPISLKEIAVETTSVAPGDRFLAFTDGLSDLMPETIIAEGLLRPGMTFDFIEHASLIASAIMPLSGDFEAADDISWMLMEVPSQPSAPSLRPPEATTQESRTETEVVQVMCTINPRWFSPADLASRIIRYLQDQGMDAAKCASLALALSEAITNALDHGVLGLDSALKASGFDAYETARQEGLNRLPAGEVGMRIHINGNGMPEAFQVRSADVCVWDSGKGFDWEAVEGPAYEGAPSGRGLALIRAVTSRVEFVPPGNQISFRIEFE